MVLWVAGEYGQVLGTPTCPQLVASPSSTSPGGGSGGSGGSNGAVGMGINAFVAVAIGMLLGAMML